MDGEINGLCRLLTIPLDEMMTNRMEDVRDVEADKPAGKFAEWLYGHARRVVIFIIGSTVLVIGILMIVLPGPAFIVIPLGLTILATEFVWARRWLDYAKRQIKSIASAATGTASQTGSSAEKDDSNSRQ